MIKRPLRCINEFYDPFEASSFLSVTNERREIDNDVVVSKVIRIVFSLNWMLRCKPMRFGERKSERKILTGWHLDFDEIERFRSSAASRANQEKKSETKKIRTSCEFYSLRIGVNQLIVRIESLQAKRTRNKW